MEHALPAVDEYSMSALPTWTDIQRNEYFSLTTQEEKAVAHYHHISTAIYFILKLVFFKATQTFQLFNEQAVKHDIRYIQQRFFPSYQHPVCFPHAQKTIARVENKILSLCGYQRCRGEIVEKLKKQLLITASRYPKKRALYKATIDRCHQQHIVLPAQTTLDKIVNDIWQQEQQRLHKALKRYTKQSQRKLLDSLLAKQETHYPIIELRQEMKSFKTFEVDKALKQHDHFRVIFDVAKYTIPKLKITANTIDYYASLVNYYKGTQLSRLNKQTVQIYLLCYCYLQFQKTNDQLLDAFKKKVMDMRNQSIKIANTRLANHLGQSKQIRQQVSKMLLAIKHAKHKTHIPKTTLFHYVPENELEMAAALLVNDGLDPDALFWQEIDNNAAIITRNLQPLFLALDLVIVRHPPLKEATEYVQQALSQKRASKSLPLPTIVSEWLSDKVKPHILPNDDLKLNRLIFWIYYQLAEQIKSNKLTLKYTLKNKDIGDDLIPESTWSKNENKILKQFPYKTLREKPHRLISNAKEINHSLYECVNQEIERGENDSIILLNDDNQTQQWRLKPLTEENIANDSIFAKLPKRSIIDVMLFVNQQINYTHKFDSILPKSAKHSSNPIYVIAGILANALGVSTSEMGELSDLNQHTLLSVEKSCIRMETITEALQHIYHQVSSWPLFKDWNINTIAHGSLDGLKLSTQHIHHKARFSKKYFGTGAGLSSYNLILNHFPLLGTLIGTNEYEGHFAFELCQFQQLSQMTLEQISSDKHGINSINFSLFFLIDLLFAPRIPKIHKETLWGFGKKSQYDGYLIRPSGIMNESNFCQEWSNIQRVVASMLTGDVNASVIIRKFASPRYCSKTKLAFTHYNHILRSNFILQCIQDTKFRHSIERALNRGEAFNRLYRTICLLNKGKLGGQNEVEMMISDGCTRLLAAIILYYNSYILNALYEQASSEDIKAFLRRASPVAWDHIRFLGYYVFLNQQLPDVEQWIKRWCWDKFVQP